MPDTTRLVKTAVSIAAVVITGAYVWRIRAAHESPRTTLGRVTINPAVAADVSQPLSLSPPNEDAPAATVSGRESLNPPTRLPVSRAMAEVEQMAPGTKPAATLVVSFDGLGVGFQGPHGTGRGGSPSDDGLAVGPNHIMQVVNGRGIAIFTKKGKTYDTTGRVLFGPVRSNNVFKNFTGNCEARSSGDVVVRYDQLADRWLIVQPLFSRGPVRADQPEPFGPADGARASVIGVAGQPGKAETMFIPPPPPPPDPADTVGPGGRGRQESAAQGCAEHPDRGRRPAARYAVDGQRRQRAQPLRDRLEARVAFAALDAAGAV